jgi:hypothetical protein
MPHRKALREQFNINGDTVVHAPTGAFWKAYDKDAELSALYMWHLGSVLDSGDEYDRGDAHDLAMTMLEKGHI